MRPELWIGFGIAAWALVAWIIWLSFCWAEGTAELKGDDLFSASFISQAWPLVLVLVVALGAIWMVFYPFFALHRKVSESVARRGRERKESGIANSHDGRVIAEGGPKDGGGHQHQHGHCLDGKRGCTSGSMSCFCACASCCSICRP